MTPAEARILVVEDDGRQRELLAGFLSARGYAVEIAESGEAALARLEAVSCHLVLMDVRMPGISGLDALAAIRETRPDLPVILVTAHAAVEDAVHAMREGAVDYLEKPVDLEELAVVVAECLGEPASRSGEAGSRALPEGFVCESPLVRRVVDEAWLVADSDATVLITGESGTGKERVAEIVQTGSARRDAPFLRVNCAAIAPTLVESELFGHVRGAFTGAAADREGRFAAASGGTILLDEVGELSLEVQPKLLRVIEDGVYERVGESSSRRTDVRVIACTHRDLEVEVREGRFREDLFWRLNVFRLHVPPLRERREEIVPLFRVHQARSGRPRARLSPAAAATLESWCWPGNVRELSNVAVRASILATGGVVLPEHLPDRLRQGAVPSSAPVAAAPAGEGAERVLTVEEAERRAIRDALARTSGNRTRAAKLLGISRRTLLYRLKRYGGEP